MHNFKRDILHILQIFCVLFLPSFLLSHAKKPSAAGTKKEKVQRLLLRNRWTSWSSRAGQIRTFSFHPIGGQSVFKPDGLGAILVVERDQHPVIVQKNGIYKNFNQRFPLLFLRNIELSKFHQPESDEILIEARLLQLFVCNFAVSSSFWISSASRRSFIVRVYKPSSIAFIRLSSFLLTSCSCFSSSGTVVFS